MGSTSPRPPILADGACSRGEWSNEACGSCRCGADTEARRETGTIMAISPGNLASPPAAWTGRPPGLLADLKARGLLDDTLLVWTTEFGRMPFSQGSVGRDHNGGTFVSWFAGGGVKPGVAHGQSDEWSWKAVDGVTTTYDFHATILHILGINHEKLTVRHGGIDRRLTDVHGRVVKEILR